MSQQNRHLSRKIAAMLRMRGWQLQPDAMGPICELLSSETDDMEGSLNRFLKAIEAVAGTAST